jgi:hypothetical protein
MLDHRNQLYTKAPRARSVARARMGALHWLAATFARIGDRHGPSPRPEALERLQIIISPTAYRDIVRSLSLVKAPALAV